MKRLYEYGGLAASVVLIAFGIGSVVVGWRGRGDVRDELARLLRLTHPPSATSEAYRRFSPAPRLLRRRSSRET